jgi:hypothetical protein
LYCVDESLARTEKDFHELFSCSGFEPSSEEEYLKGNVDKGLIHGDDGGDNNNHIPDSDIIDIIDDLTVNSMSNLNLDEKVNDNEDTKACIGNSSFAETLSGDSTCEGEDKGSEAKNGNHIPVFIIEKLQEFLDLSNTDPSFKNLQSEESLANFLKNRMSSAGAVLKAEEWEVVEGESHQGRGDLVFHLLFDIDLRLPFGIDLVVEVKKIDPISTGGSNKTHSTTRNKQRSKVEEQAIKYAKIWQCSKSDVEIVVATIFTEEDGLKCIRGFTNRYTTPS